jgi:hypothetical protein
MKSRAIPQLILVLILLLTLVKTTDTAARPDTAADATTLSVPSQAGRTFFVDYADGDDDADGTGEQTPWKHAPGDPQATGNPASAQLEPGDTVLFKGGTVYRGEINVNADGAEDNPITYRGDGWGTENAIIDGSEVLTGTWIPCESEAACGGNPNWQNIYYLDTSEALSVFTPLYEDDEFLWFSQDPNQPDPFWFDELEHYCVVPIDDPTITLARTSLTDPTYFTQNDPHYWDGAYVAAWRIPNIVVVEPITGYDPGSNTITFDLGGDVYTDRDSYYALINHVAHIDLAGEYAFDAAAQRLYLWPRSADPSQAEISVGKRRRGFELDGHSHVVIQGFKIQRFFGNLEQWYQGVGVYNDDSTAQNVTVRDNEITQLRSMVGAGAIEMRNVAGILVDGNDVHENQKNSGIRFGGQNITITNNIVQRIGRTGIIFMGVQHGQIVNNTISDILGVHGNGLSVYQYSADVLVAGNRISKSGSPLTFERSDDLTFINNVIDANDGESNVNEWDDQSGGTIVFVHNTVVRNSRNASLNIGGGGADLYVVKNNILDGGPSGESVERSHNIYTGLGWWQDERYGWALAEGEMIKEDLSEIFVAPGGGDFRLKEGSPAIDAGDDVAAYLPTDVFPAYDFGLDVMGAPRPQGSRPDIGAYEFTPGLELHGTPASQAIHLSWSVNVTLPATSTWQIDYQSQTGTAYLPITGIISPTRAYTLTGLTNYVWYTVTLNAMLDPTPFLTDTVRVMPTDRFVYLPLVLRGN